MSASVKKGARRHSSAREMHAKESRGGARESKIANKSSERFKPLETLPLDDGGERRRGHDKGDALDAPASPKAAAVKNIKAALAKSELSGAGSNTHDLADRTGRPHKKHGSKDGTGCGSHYDGGSSCERSIGSRTVRRGRESSCSRNSDRVGSGNEAEGRSISEGGSESGTSLSDGSGGASGSTSGSN
eukprot:3406010-Pleurochrysis_carterae.AAC.2